MEEGEENTQLTKHLGQTRLTILFIFIFFLNFIREFVSVCFLKEEQQQQQQNVYLCVFLLYSRQ